MSLHHPAILTCKERPPVLAVAIQYCNHVYAECKAKQPKPDGCRPAVLDTKPAYTSVTSPSINLLLIGLGRTWLPLGNRNGTGVVHFLLIASVL